MCRNIKTLFNFEPPATEEEIRASALQFVRKLSGFNTPSKATKAFNLATSGHRGAFSRFSPGAVAPTRSEVERRTMRAPKGSAESEFELVRAVMEIAASGRRVSG